MNYIFITYIDRDSKTKEMTREQQKNFLQKLESFGKHQLELSTKRLAYLIQKELRQRFTMEYEFQRIGDSGNYSMRARCQLLAQSSNRIKQLSKDHNKTVKEISICNDRIIELRNKIKLNQFFGSNGKVYHDN